jgi:hypothetical protein
MTLAPQDIRYQITQLTSGGFSSGQTIALLQTLDPDSWGFNYSLAPGTGDTSNSIFQIVNNNLRISNLSAFNAASSYSLRVRSTDATGLSFEKQIVIQKSQLQSRTGSYTSGDVHVLSLNGYYDFQYAGDFYYAKSADGGTEIQGRLEEIPPWWGATVTTSIAFQLGGHLATIDRYSNVSIDGISANSLFQDSSFDVNDSFNFDTGNISRTGGNSYYIKDSRSAEQYVVLVYNGYYIDVNYAFSVSNAAGLTGLVAGYRNISSPDVNVAAGNSLFNNSLPWISVRASDDLADERGISLGKGGVFTLTRSGNITDALTVSIALDRSATNGLDYETIPSTVVFAAGSSTATVTINPKSDSLFEGIEYVRLKVVPGSGYNLAGVPAADIAIFDIPSLSISPVVSIQAEGDSDIKIYTFNVNRTGPTSGTSKVQWVVSGRNGSANPAQPSDFEFSQFPSGSITFNDNVSSATIEVKVLGDSQAEASEEFTVTLLNPTDATIAVASADGVIINDDPYIIGLSASPNSIIEDGSAKLIYTFTRSAGDLATAVTVNFNVGGTATFGSDYSQIGATSFNGTNGSITFEVGETTKQIQISSITDNIFELDETVSLTLIGGTGYQPTSLAPVTSVILDDDTILDIQTAVVDQPEGNTGSTRFNFVITRTGDISHASDVHWAVTGSGAFPATASDFVGGVLPSGNIYFAAGQFSSTIEDIFVNADKIGETDETFTVTLSSPQGAVIGTSTASGIIRNDDTFLSVVPAELQQVESDEGPSQFVFIVSRTGALNTETIANWSVQGSGANPAIAADFFGGILPSGEVRFKPNETTRPIFINVNGDTAIEDDEDFILTLSPLSGASILSPIGTAKILNDDSGFEISSLTPSQNEGNSGSTIFNFKIKRFGLNNQAGSIDWSLSGSGSNPASISDFVIGQPLTGHLDFQAGDSEKIVSIQVQGDSTVEKDEEFTLTLGNPIGTPITAGSANSIIVNDDTSVSIATTATSEQFEGNSGVKSYGFKLTREGLKSGVSSVRWVVSGSGTNPAAPTDFVGGTFPSDIFTFVPGTDEGYVTIQVNSDTNFEADEGFVVTLVDPQNTTIGTASVAGIIRNDDSRVSISSTATSIQPEGDSGSKLFRFKLLREGFTAGTSSVDWVVGGSGANPATASDFVGGIFPSGTSNFTADQTEAYIDVLVSGDTEVEFDESFSVTLLNPVNTEVGTGSAAGVINNDDTSLSIFALNADQLEGNTGEKIFTFTVNRIGDLNKTTTVNWSASGIGTFPVAASDFIGNAIPSGSLIFNPGDADAKIIEIKVKSDLLGETDETFKVNLSSAVGGNIATATALGTIRNDDTFLSIEQASSEQLEGESGNTPFTFTVKRTGVLTGSSSASWQLVGHGSNPVDSSDFQGGVLPSGIVSFGARETTKPIIINVNGDLDYESDEGFSISLSPLSGASIVSPDTAAGTIFNEDLPIITLEQASDAAEGIGGDVSHIGSFTLNRTGWLGNALTVYFGLGGTATAGLDYHNPGASVTFGPGSATATVKFNIVDDCQQEGTENVVLTLLPSESDSYALSTDLSNQSKSLIIANSSARGVVPPAEWETLRAEVIASFIARGITNPDETVVNNIIYDLYITKDESFIDSGIDSDETSQQPALCLAAGSLIRTPEGLRPVESLAIGDLVLTPDGPQPLKFLGISRRHRNSLRAQGRLPMRIRPGALAPHCPSAELYCTPSHALWIEGRLVEAGALLNGSSISQLADLPAGQDHFTYYSMELECHALIWANDLLCETYVPTYRDGELTRVLWDNYDHYLSLYHSSEPMQELACPRIPFARLLPEFIRRQVAERALVTGDANSLDSNPLDGYNLDLDPLGNPFLDHCFLDNRSLDSWSQDERAVVLR